ncbi:alpha-hydroxy-acid oxidizing protein [Desulfobotulus sp. H1]|uniref:Alpha-hydroxy-acid oxidizing protein n=1 Tax=Desulfobotulus pelophilus TaxID=2823377 RepID=A0ABT3N788_9BACT|nr:alpha-hydroxy-acid oxidizing protein [Desulfobotulus pelophilus]MCW7753323.1 alpha-hydroxy-acid oxidizing protein [Desulfobotulus pelophilus]
MKSIRDTARERMTGYCRVCPICNGKNCASGVPGMGGIGTGEAFRANGEALADIRLNMRLIHDITEPDTRTELFGATLDFPLLAAPIGGVSYNMGGAVSEAAYIHAIVDGCCKEGLIGCTGDGVPPEISQCGFQAIEAAKGQAIPFIKPWEDKELFEKLDRALACNPMAIGMDIDAAGLITLRLQGRPVSPKSISKLREIRKYIQRPFILKGIMTGDQAELAMDAGADAIVVSNHGGRVLDMTPGTADVLPEIVETVNGKIRVLVDGGIRSGVDILKMLALGADAVLIGRPFSIAACGGETEGVSAYIRQLRTELKQAMVMTGCASIADVDESILY